MKIYIDSDYKCHTENADGRVAIETNYFDGKCKGYIEGYRYIPDGKTWTRTDGVVFHGIMVAPFIDYDRLSIAQEQYELDQAQAADMAEALSILGVTE